ncbi:hypothetical protein NDN08_000323 [Rhodosorus marinus]|uniref:CCHC-type domain-containing protein n=1 Tax=Rhodosorus marinus TaxID=101924 RepID=A0AAV8UMK8_9RHOD|nr:hypothetical protein NDN08_000323 [Rhodosorus marinus]
MKSEDSNKNTQKSGKAPRPRQYKCGACNEEGHNARNCRKRLEQNAGYDGGSNESPIPGLDGVEKVDVESMGGKRKSHQPQGFEMGSQMKGIEHLDGSGMASQMYMMHQDIPDQPGQGQNPFRFQQIQGGGQSMQDALEGGGVPGSFNDHFEVTGHGLDDRGSMDQMVQQAEMNGHYRSAEDRHQGLERALQAAETIVMRMGNTVASAKSAREYESTSKDLLLAIDNLEKVAKVAQRYKKIAEDIEANNFGAVEDVSRARNTADLQNYMQFL